MPNKLHNEIPIWYRNYKISYGAPLNPNNFIMYIPRNWISDFGVRRLASSEVISQVLFTPEHQAARETLKIDHFSVNWYRYSSFGRYLFNLCGIY